MREPFDEAFASEPAQVVGGLAGGVGVVEQGGDGAEQGGVVEPGHEVAEADGGGQDRHHPLVPEPQPGGMQAVGGPTDRSPGRR